MDTEVAEDFAENAGVDPSPQEVDQYLQMQPATEAPD